MEVPKMRTPNLNSMVDFQKMVFVYNAVNDGWTVKILDDGRYEFRKEDNKITSDQCMDTYLREFVQFYRKLKEPKKETKIN